MINENALCKLITTWNHRNIVNLKDDGFEYTNGCFVANCSYSNQKVMSKLFSVGALKGKRGMEAEQTYDLSEFLKPRMKYQLLRLIICDKRKMFLAAYSKSMATIIFTTKLTLMYSKTLHTKPIPWTHMEWR